MFEGKSALWNKDSAFYTQHALTAPLCMWCPHQSGEKLGSHKSMVLGQAGYGTIQRVPWGPLNRVLSAPYSRGSTLSVETHCFGPWVCQSVTPHVHCTGPPPPTVFWPGFHPSHPRGRWEQRGINHTTPFSLVLSILCAVPPKSACSQGVPMPPPNAYCDSGGATKPNQARLGNFVCIKTRLLVPKVRI